MEEIYNLTNLSNRSDYFLEFVDKFEEKDYAKATRAEAIRMRDELNKAIKNNRR